MSLADLKLNSEYNNQDVDVVNEFLVPTLNEAVEYDRAVGFFSSTSLLSISVGIKQLIKNGGRIKMICSPRLSNEDIEAIKKGYQLRDVADSRLLKDFCEPCNEFESERLNILSHLVSEGIMDIKIAVMKNPNSMFHLKLGVVKDENGNFIAFNGSMNDSVNAYYGNGETIDVFSSLNSDFERAMSKKQYFDRLWDEQDENIMVYDFPEAARDKLNTYKKNNYDIEIDNKEYKYDNKVKKMPRVPSYVQIRDYQEQAYETWKNNEYKGIYDMATGTGKTYTALYSMVNILKEKNGKLFTVICCPYQHLVDQWSTDLDAFGFQYVMGFSESKHKKWKEQLKKGVFNYTHKINDSFIFITTNATFATDYVQKLLLSIKGEILLVIDEAHNFGTDRLSNLLDDKFTYRLALSATLDRHNDLVGTTKLYDFFEKKCISYSLEQAIHDKKLCKYYYYPIKVNLDDEEYEKYNKLSEEISKYIKIKNDGTVEYSKKAEMLLIKRARLVAGAKMKLEALKEVAAKYKNDNHLIVYCGATTVVDDDYKENVASEYEIKQIDRVVEILNSIGMQPAKFTSEEDARTRELLKNSFDEGITIKSLVAIRCLDEGVNIPSIDKAIILASSTNPKEYIQRRGRVLRTYDGKDYATIYDFITLPRALEDLNYGMDIGHDLGLIKREVARMKDFSKLSLNEFESDALITEIEDIYGYIDENEECYE